MAYITAADCLGMVKLQTLISLFFDVAAKTEALPATIALCEAEATKWHFTEAVLAASGELDSYLRGRYAVPVGTLSAELKDAVIVLTIYRGYVRRNVLTEEQRNIYKDKIAWLTRISKGEVELSIAVEAETQSRGRIFTTSKTLLLTQDGLTGI
jgi:phage gp36-like protein